MIQWNNDSYFQYLAEKYIEILNKKMTGGVNVNLINGCFQMATIFIPCHFRFRSM